MKLAKSCHHCIGIQREVEKGQHNTGRGKGTEWKEETSRGTEGKLVFAL